MKEKNSINQQPTARVSSRDEMIRKRTLRRKIFCIKTPVDKYLDALPVVLILKPLEELVVMRVSQPRSLGKRHKICQMQRSLVATNVSNPLHQVLALEMRRAPVLVAPVLVLFMLNSTVHGEIRARQRKVEVKARCENETQKN